jgi:hypothetical protein
MTGVLGLNDLSDEDAIPKTVEARAKAMFQTSAPDQ